MRERNKIQNDDEFITDTTERAPEDIELEEEDAQMSDKIRSLREKLKICEEEKSKAFEDRERSRADFLNSKRRLEEQFMRDKERVIEKVVEDLLPLIDVYETTLSNAFLWEKLDPEWKKGIEGMHAQFRNFLKTYGVEEIEAQGKEFDPYEHEAISSKNASASHPSNTVLNVLQKGYRRGDTVIRPAKVVVAE